MARSCWTIVNGTAPGLWIEGRSSRLALLPGPPREMTPMLEALVRERLAPLTGGGGLFRRVLKITGRAESEVDAVAQPIYGPLRDQAVPIETTILAVFGQVELHLTAAAQSRAEADAALDPAVAALVAGLGPSVYSTDGTTLEAVVGDLLRASGDTVAAAESCSGGLLMSRLTDVPGSSDYVQSGVVCYSNRSKTEWVGVPADLIAAHGAVSEPVARAMAEGVRRRADATVGIGVTGIAGPGGGTADKPVGTVCLAVLTEHQAHVRTVRLVGNREQIKYQSAQAALNLLRLMLLRMSVSLLGVLAYFIGSIPFALLLARRWGTSDLRRVGSGNLGATNVLRVSGVRAGLLVALLDISKGAISVFVAQGLSGGGGAAPAVAGFAAVVGHVYPVWLKFKGGREWRPPAERSPC